ncbi:MAG: hypothetical protein IPO92_05025 [Saprospiraceae bacterium]|nr:hypothetical protein [Saprospiraceae bacterium]
MTKYFNAEKSESLIFILVGLIAIILSMYFILKVKQPFYNGMAYSLIAIALIQITVGSSVYMRSPKDIVRVNQIVQTDKSRLQTEEIPRMATVLKNFTMYKWLEITLIVAGLMMYFYLQPMTVWRGLGCGLFIQAGFMLLLDFFAESRGKAYIEYLQTLI